MAYYTKPTVKKIKRGYICLELLIIIVLSITFLHNNTSAIEIEKINNKSTNCTINNSKYVYVPSGSKTTIIYPLDSIWTDGLNIISSEKSLVKIWEQNTGILNTKCLTGDSWSRVSSVSPGNKIKVVAVANSGCEINLSRITSTDLPVAFFAFDIAVKPEIGIENEPSTLEYFYYEPNDSYKHKRQISNQMRRKWGNLNILDRGCLSVYVNFCGDGKLNVSDGEICDPADNSHKGWGSGGCNFDCTPVTVNKQKS
ncbi:hypothetical protein FY034_13270 [Trichlorobacter lovleyi]|uniref:hypothetical protein n=1 Tax=Trichlorobacter lovleyi TaxID=313985 RepID=UPI0022406EA9|nr:hypothetical protein [Trichlorobacter lovleyi]QOX79860.1 hypothetical protein FY034_13270 [Trichlorobacter lovleyi]